MVHGGEDFSGSVAITKEVISAMENNINLAPLHNPPNLQGIYAINELLPEVPQVGVFDTAFHQTMPRQAYMYALPYSLYEKYKIRRYGFHGTSHQFIAKRACAFLNLDYKNTKIVPVIWKRILHLLRIKEGKSASIPPWDLHPTKD
ncbi:MAG: hypothetical protein R2759_20640 [Bacteroidales bacterium]